MFNQKRRTPALLSRVGGGLRAARRGDERREPANQLAPSPYFAGVEAKSFEDGAEISDDPVAFDTEPVERIFMSSLVSFHLRDFLGEALLKFRRQGESELRVDLADHLVRLTDQVVVLQEHAPILG